MKSPAQAHFPQIIIENSQKWLFNPVLRKRFKDRPEERVRLAWLEYLLHQTDIKKNRIGFENPVKNMNNKHSMRADLIIYDSGMKAHVLVECKSENIPLNSKTAEQAARYNLDIGAKYIVLTNGVEDYWFETTTDGIIETASFFEEVKHTTLIRANRAYWSERGFLKSTADSKLTETIVHLLTTILGESFSCEKRYLAFQGTLSGLPLNHYYKIVELENHKKLAISLFGHDSSGQYLVGILNENGENSGMISINLENLFSGEKLAATLYKRGDISEEDADGLLQILQSADSDGYRKIPQTLMNFFV